MDTREIEGRDSESFGRLYEGHADRVYRHVLRRVGNPATAEDLTAQVFLNAWQSLDRAQRAEDRPVLAWLFSIANNLVVDYLRSNSRLLGDVDAIELLPSDSNPEEEALGAALQGELSRYIERLKPEQRLILTLRMVDGLKYQEIADLLGKSTGAVRVIQFRALAALRKLVRGQGLEERE